MAKTELSQIAVSTIKLELPKTKLDFTKLLLE